MTNSELSVRIAPPLPFDTKLLRNFESFTKRMAESAWIAPPLLALFDSKSHDSITRDAELEMEIAPPSPIAEFRRKATLLNDAEASAPVITIELI